MAGEVRRRTAIVMVHGMGEQRPLDTLFSFADFVATERRLAGKANPADRNVPVHYSRPTKSEDAFESRYAIIPGKKDGTYDQLDIYEYHWSHLMQGNKLGDMLGVTLRMLLRAPHTVPAGLLGFWILVVLAIAGITLLIWQSPLTTEDLLSEQGATLVGDLLVGVFQIGGAGVLLVLLRWAFKQIVPAKITSHFVDVVRYLDTSPRSYGVRKAIRKGMVDLLRELHEDESYDRVVLVAHSLGAYIAYDAISYYWTRTNRVYDHSANDAGKLDPDVIAQLERAADPLGSHDVGKRTRQSADTPDNPAEFRAAQRAMWHELRAKGNPWKVTDFISIGTPMYMADLLVTKNAEAFEKRISQRHIATCPPQPDYDREHGEVAQAENDGRFTWTGDNGRTYLYHAAPFGVVRWTNMWYPPRLGFFGDWFAGALRPLFGNGIRDIPLKGDPIFRRYFPAFAHAWYFASPPTTLPIEPDDEDRRTAYGALIEALEIDFLSPQGDPSSRAPTPANSPQ